MYKNLAAVVLVVTISILFAATVFAETGSPSYDGCKMTGEPNPVIQDECTFEIVLLSGEEEVAVVPQYFSATEPLYASYLAKEALWNYRPDAILEGLYTDRACSEKFKWGTAVGEGVKRLYGRFVNK